MSVQVVHVSKAFGRVRVLEDVSLEAPTGTLVALLGPSGSGKTTLLRIIAGLEVPDHGQVLIEGEEASARSPGDRRVGFVFQHYALFRHMTVFENVAFGMRVRPRRSRPARGALRSRVNELLALVQIDRLAARYPSQLSGGQRQRVALARALAVEPRVLLLDEPFGSLDAKVRKELRRWLRRLHEDLHVTTVFVTHDQDEALELADRVVILHDGRVQQVGAPDDVYRRPANAFVYGFLGDVNLFHGRVTDGKVRLGPVGLILPESTPPSADAALVYVRPHHLRVHQHREGGHCFRAEVIRVRHIGPLIKLELRSEWGAAFEVDVPQHSATSDVAPGTNVFVSVAPDELLIEPLPDGESA